MIRFLAVPKFCFFDAEKSVHTPLFATVLPMSHLALQNHPQNFPDWIVALRKESKKRFSVSSFLVDLNVYSKYEPR